MSETVQETPKNLTKKQPTKKEKLVVDLAREREIDRQKVKGIFRYYEQPGTFLKFNFKKYKQDQIEEFLLWDNQVYELPLGVAKHLNTNGWYPEYSYMNKDDGIKTGFNNMAGTAMRISHKVRRFGFQSLEFTDIDGLPNNPQPQEIVGVEQIL